MIITVRLVTTSITSHCCNGEEYKISLLASFEYMIESW